MNTLSDLKAGRLAGATRVEIAEGLTDFPPELFALSDTLEILDLSNNRIKSLPLDFYRFNKLRILFLSNNDFESFPMVLGQCPALTMVGFKKNQITDVPEGALPLKLRWLILTDNQIDKLPHSIGTNIHLRKVMLSGNHIRALPDEMANCVNIELLRISANQLESLPPWLLTLPKLSWFAFAGNPCSLGKTVESSLREIHWNDLQLNCLLGEGASGVISQARWNEDTDVAIKEFKGLVTSDGLPADEMTAAMAAGQHKNLVKLLGKLVGHPEQKSGLLLALIDQDFRNLAGPPSLESCTRDIYAPTRYFGLNELLNIVEAIASVAAHLHERKIMHGDLYAHNILVNEAADCLLGDFGAATIYTNLSDDIATTLEQLEVRAFGCLLEELMIRLDSTNRENDPAIVTQLTTLQERCMDPMVRLRPLFAEVVTIIERIGCDYSQNHSAHALRRPDKPSH